MKKLKNFFKKIGTALAKFFKRVAEKAVKTARKIGKKRLIIISSVLAVIIAAAIGFTIYITGDNLINVSVEKSKTYSSISGKDTGESEIEKALEKYSVTEKDNGKEYTKDDETIFIKTDKNGKVIFKSYNKKMSNMVQSKISDFNESMISLGMKEDDVLKKLEKYNYIYNLSTEENGKSLDVYYYGWTGKEAVLKLVFKDGKLTYYTINSSNVVKDVTAP